MKRSMLGLAVFLALAVLGLAVFNYLRDDSKELAVSILESGTPVPAPVPSADHVDGHGDDHDHAHSSAPAQPPAAASDEEVNLSTSPLDAPPVTELREEVAKNPHETPHSLLEYSSRMALFMEKALASEDGGKEFFPRLESCARQEGSPTSVRGICLANASRLAKKYPAALSGKYQSLRESLPQSLRTIVEATGIE